MKPTISSLNIVLITLVESSECVLVQLVFLECKREKFEAKEKGKRRISEQNRKRVFSSFSSFIWFSTQKSQKQKKSRAEDGKSNLPDFDFSQKEKKVSTRFEKKAEKPSNNSESFLSDKNHVSPHNSQTSFDFMIFPLKCIRPWKFAFRCREHKTIKSNQSDISRFICRLRPLVGLNIYFGRPIVIIKSLCNSYSNFWWDLPWGGGKFSIFT